MVDHHTLNPAAHRASGGFTLIEVLVVMAVLGILAAAVMPLGEALLKSQKERDLRAALWEIRGAIDAHKRLADQGNIAAGPTGSGYPASLESLVNGVDDIKSGSDGKVYLLRRLPKDPFAAPGVTAAASWRLRSYASPPDDPRPGADVFDIRSSSDALALNGTTYASW